MESELEAICQDILDLLDQYLIEKASDVESTVFYKKVFHYVRYVRYIRYESPVFCKKACCDAATSSRHAVTSSCNAAARRDIQTSSGNA